MRCRIAALPVSVIAAVALLLIYALINHPPPDQREVTVNGVGYSGSISLPVSYGLAKGIFRKHGINLTYVPMKDAYTTMLTFSAGQIDVNSQSPGVSLSALEEGQPFKIGISVSTASNLMLIAKPPVQDVLELRGKTIGVMGRNSDAYRAISWYLEAKGLKMEEDATVVEIKSPASLVTSLEVGQVDAAVLWAGYAARALEIGGGKVVSCTEAFEAVRGHPLHVPILLLGENLLSREDVARDFLRAMREICREIAKNKEEAARIWSEYADQPLNEMRMIVESTEMVGDLSEQIQDDILAFLDYGVGKGCFDKVPGREIFYDEWR